jgi:hypothetical protein
LATNNLFFPLATVWGYFVPPTFFFDCVVANFWLDLRYNMDVMMQQSAQKTEFRSQQYRTLWPAVLISERAEAKIRDLEILYGAFPRALDTALIHVLRGNYSKEATNIQVVEILAADDVPAGIKLSYRVTEEGVLLCDLWTPVQPSLFGV